ncbi:unnamed protein product [Leptosia nina]|uniref:Uncharacterized protein n=1 Tax=Leptosia nina TaxID=320188 RepID=A0AAV1J902_9NEOP
MLFILKKSQEAFTKAGNDALTGLKLFRDFRQTFSVFSPAFFWLAYKCVEYSVGYADKITTVPNTHLGHKEWRHENHHGGQSRVPRFEFRIRHQ